MSEETSLLETLIDHNMHVAMPALGAPCFRCAVPAFPNTPRVTGAYRCPHKINQTLFSLASFDLWPLTSKPKLLMNTPPTARTLLTNQIQTGTHVQCPLWKSVVVAPTNPKRLTSFFLPQTVHSDLCVCVCVYVCVYVCDSLCLCVCVCVCVCVCFLFV